MTGDIEFEVTEPVFNMLCKDRASLSLTYGNPGVRIFKSGTMGKILRNESISADANYNRSINETVKKVPSEYEP